MIVLLFGEIFICIVVALLINRLATHSIRNISNSVDKLDKCVKIISHELDDVAEAIHDLKDQH